MIRNLIKKVFDVREGEFKISILMQAYIFLIIAVLLIIKPTVNAQFLSELGAEQLPFAFLAVALTAILSSFFYSKALTRFSLDKIIKITLICSIVVLLGLGLLLKMNLVVGWLLYIFYIWVAIYAVLTASQFWVLANLVFNVREAKRLFGLIGSGAILGGIFGGYLTSLLAPLVGNENLILLAAALLVFCFPLLGQIWRLRVRKLGRFKENKRIETHGGRPFQLIIKSRHLTYMAAILAVSVIVAKLVDYLFSDFAASALPDPEELTAFFAFWFSTFNLLSLVVQLFFTHRIVGIWGVGFSLLLLPIGIFGGGLLFLVLPELSAVVVIKAMDGILKQSVHKSATELLVLPLPFELKNKTKSFIDVVVDSIATGIAGFLLIFVLRGLELPLVYIAVLILVLVLLWMFFILQVRKEYYTTFRTNLEHLTERKTDTKKPLFPNTSVVKGMRTVFRSGNERQILYMLSKLMEINDKRFEPDVEALLQHESILVRTEAVRNLYFLNNTTMVTNISELLKTDDEALSLAVLEYLLLHAGKQSGLVYDHYLNHKHQWIADTALYCLAREARDNNSLKKSYGLRDRIADRLSYISQSSEKSPSLKLLLKTIGVANIPEFYSEIAARFKHENREIQTAAVTAAGESMQNQFILDLLTLLPDKRFRTITVKALHNYGPKIISVLVEMVKSKQLSPEIDRQVPAVLKTFHSKEAVQHLFILLESTDLAVRLETIRALSDIRRNAPQVKFDRYAVADLILEECKTYHRTLSAMHTQIIISYRNRNKSKQEIGNAERDARTSLLEILERRLDAGLERIFKLLGLKYHQRDIETAYEGLVNDKQEVRLNAIEFLDNLLTGNLKRTLLPIIEETILDATSEDGLQKIKHKIPTEMECFQLLLKGNDLKVKLSVLYLIKHQKNTKYIPLLLQYSASDDMKISTFAKEALDSF